MNKCKRPKCDRIIGPTDEEVFEGYCGNSCNSLHKVEQERDKLKTALEKLTTACIKKDKAEKIARALHNSMKVRIAAMDDYQDYRIALAEAKRFFK